MKKIVYLSLGTNLGDRQANLRNAIGRLLELGDVLEVSSYYETEPVEFTEQPWFLNCAVAVRTQLLPRDFLKGIQAIEKSIGRQHPGGRGGPPPGEAVHPVRRKSIRDLFKALPQHGHAIKKLSRQ